MSTLAIIDDDKLLHRATELLLSKVSPDTTILHYYSGLEALEYLQQNPAEEPDVILLDLNMPIMDGWQFLDALVDDPRFETKNWKIYICSSSMDPRDIQKANDYDQVYGYLGKPITRANLKSVMENI